VSDGPVGARTADGRLHLQHGPIDLIIDVEGPPAAIRAAELAAAGRFATILEELVAELDLLRAAVPPNRDGAGPVTGPVARRMLGAVEGLVAILPEQEVTAMAAVAGAVADEVLAAMVATGPLERAYVNDGGDIAFHLAPGAAPFRVGLFGELATAETVGALSIVPDSGHRGVATSGLGGRSLTLGIADAVTALAPSAAAADVAATIVANAVDLPGHPGIERVPASERDAASDLGDRLVTAVVPSLTPAEAEQALAAGAAVANRLREAGYLGAAVLSLQGRRTVVAGPDA
jgi:uncharacterized protein